MSTPTPARACAQRAAALMFQSAFRMRRARHGYLMSKQSAILIQVSIPAASSLAASHCAMPLYSSRLQPRCTLNFTSSSLLSCPCQSAMRGRLSRRELEVAKAAAVRLQAVVRMRRSRNEFLQARSGAVLLQAGWRGAKARGELAMQRQAALWFQAAWRRRRAMRTYRTQKQGGLLDVYTALLCVLLH